MKTANSVLQIPAFNSPELTRLSRLIGIFLIALFCSEGIGVLLRILLTPEEFFPRFLFTAAYGICAAVTLILLRRRRPKLSSAVLIVSVGTLIALASIVRGGNGGATFSYLGFSVIMAGLLAGKRAAVMTLAAAAAFGLLLVHLENSGVPLMAAKSVSPMNFWIGGLQFFILITLTLMLTLDDIARAMELSQTEASGRQRFELAYAEAEAVHQITLSQMSDAVFITTDDGVFKYVCPNVHVLFKYSKDEVFGLTNIANLIPTLVLDPADVRARGEISNIEHSVEDRHGTSKEVLVSVKSVAIGGGTLLYTCRDVTELKEAERIRTEVESEKEKVMFRQRFLSTASHDLRSPLTVILATKETLAHYFERMDKDKLQQMFKRIGDQALRMTEMLNNVLTISKSQAGLLAFNPAPLDLIELCTQQLDPIIQIDNGGHDISFDARGDFTGAVMDMNLLMHILTNLLSNAVKYTPAGRKVSLLLNREGDTAVFKVADEGLGIPTADQARLFSPFHRADNVGHIQGTGLGLPIVKDCVESHGGSITFTSVQNEGTTFDVRLPLRPA